MKSITKRSILRWIHLGSTIPVLGFIYQPATEVQQYVDGPRYIFVPLLILTGYWMYSGIYFAILGVVIWMSGYYLSGFGGALLGQIALLIGGRLWQVMCARRLKAASPSTNGI